MKNIKRIVYVILALSVLLSLVACGDKTKTSTKSDKMVIAVSIVPEETFVKAVCGDLVDTIVMIPPGASPENYEPSPMEMEKFSKATYYFSIGVPAEETNIIPSLAENTELVSLSDACAEKYEERKIGNGRDPHIWLSPKRAVIMVNTIAEKMSEIDAENAETYSNNAKNYIAKINEADEKIRESLKNINSHSFIAYHPSFGYFADDYGLDMYALEIDGKEATATGLAEMVDFAKSNDIEVIFYQAEIDSSQSKAFAEEIGGRTVQLDPLSSNYIENLKTMAEIFAKEIN